MKRTGPLFLSLIILFFLLFTGTHGQEESPPDTLTADQETANTVLGAGIYRTRCAFCHGEEGDGRGPSAGFLKPSPPDLTDGIWIHGPDMAEITRVLRAGVTGTAMPGYANVLTRDEIRSLAVYVLELGGITVESGETDSTRVDGVEEPPVEDSGDSTVR